MMQQHVEHTVLTPQCERVELKVKAVKLMEKSFQLHTKYLQCRVTSDFLPACTVKQSAASGGVSMRHVERSPTAINVDHSSGCLRIPVLQAEIHMNTSKAHYVITPVSKKHAEQLRRQTLVDSGALGISSHPHSVYFVDLADLQYDGNIRRLALRSKEDGSLVMSSLLLVDSTETVRRPVHRVFLLPEFDESAGSGQILYEMIELNIEEKVKSTPKRERPEE
ncbi:hypothetical protein ADEAN_000606800 [Angomonas deanei]|uniref:Uncharacterized protein n=1 Tax=Angomonas deanei TaxID=59799 RepID=A0A7G2CHP0_9TRYP|nr:hypothetical protein ADEAN_000606800 [Angomonas deanei]